MEAQEEYQEEHQEQESLPTAEETARLSGWVPEEEFRGDKERWTPADKWNERTETLMPILKTQLKKYEKELIESKESLTATKSEIEGLRKTMERMANVSSKISQREYDRAIETIKEQQLAAVENADSDAFQELESQKEKLEKPETIEMETPKAPAIDANKEQADQWKAENKWYEEKPQLGMYASSIENFVATQNPGKSVKEILDLVTLEVKKRFPDDFKNPARNTPSAVDSSGVQPGGGGSSKNGWSSLPKEAMAQFNSLVDKIPGYTKEEFLSAYYE